MHLSSHLNNSPCIFVIVTENSVFVADWPELPRFSLAWILLIVSLVSSRFIDIAWVPSGLRQRRRHSWSTKFCLLMYENRLSRCLCRFWSLVSELRDYDADPGKHHNYSIIFVNFSSFLSFYVTCYLYPPRASNACFYSRYEMLSNIVALSFNFFSFFTFLLCAFLSPLSFVRYLLYPFFCVISCPLTTYEIFRSKPLFNRKCMVNPPMLHTICYWRTSYIS